MLGYLARTFLRRWVWIIAGAILFALAGALGIDLR